MGVQARKGHALSFLLHPRALTSKQRLIKKKSVAHLFFGSTLLFFYACSNVWGFPFPLCHNLDRIFGRVAVFCFKLLKGHALRVLSLFRAPTHPPLHI